MKFEIQNARRTSRKVPFTVCPILTRTAVGGQVLLELNIRFH
jgi:hypothetical protein